ncbi:hypothetical protein MKX08_004132 [Trichoderma sp. CBMAI-0020]|nr:hypothetical protein MKX08_004132 [Trichoderma sp. CBMAI-0020]
MKFSTTLVGTLSLLFPFSNGQPVEGQPAEGQPAEGQPAEGQPAEGQPAESGITEFITATDLIIQEEAANSTSNLTKRDVIAYIRFFQYPNCQGNVLQLNVDRSQVNAGYVDLQGAKTFIIAATTVDAVVCTAGDLTDTVTEVVHATQTFPNPNYARILGNTLTQPCHLSDSCLHYADGTERPNASLKLQAEIKAAFKAKEVECAEKVADHLKLAPWEQSMLHRPDLQFWLRLSLPSSTAALLSLKQMQRPPTDPAAAPPLAPFLNDIYSYLAHSPNDGVYWAKSKDSKDEDGKVQQAHGLTRLLTNVTQQEKLALAIKAQVLKSSDMAAGTDAATIKSWPEDTKNAKAIALKLEEADPAPGGHGDGYHLRQQLQIKALKELREAAEERDVLNNWATSVPQAILKTVADKENDTEMLEKAGVTMDQTFVAVMRTGAATVTEHVEKSMPKSLAIRFNEDLSI